LAYAAIGASLGWRNGGGTIPVMVLFAVWAATWTAITNLGKSASDDQDLAKSPSNEPGEPTESGFAAELGSGDERTESAHLDTSADKRLETCDADAKPTRSSWDPATLLVIGIISLTSIGSVTFIVMRNGATSTLESPSAQTYERTIRLEDLGGQDSLSESQTTETQPDHEYDHATPPQPQFKQKWPRAFVRNLSEAAPVTDHSSMISKDGSAEISAALKHWLGRELWLERIKEEFPRFGRRIGIAELALNRKFRPAIENMERIQRERIPNWQTEWSDIRTKTKRELWSKPVSQEIALAAVEELEKWATSGQLDLPGVEILLIHHPEYIRNPAREFLDGFAKEFVTDGSGKSMGLKPRIMYPVSWQAKTGERPHIVQKFGNRSGRSSTSSVVLGVSELPQEVRSAIESARETEGLSEHEVILVLTLARSGGIYGDAASQEIVDSGTVVLAGHSAAWVEYKAHLNRVGIEFDVHGLIFGVIRRERLVTIMLDTTSVPQLETTTADDRFRQVAPLFRQMLNSFDLFDRYDDTPRNQDAVDSSLTQPTSPIIINELQRNRRNLEEVERIRRNSQPGAAGLASPRPEAETSGLGIIICFGPLLLLVIILGFLSFRYDNSMPDDDPKAETYDFMAELAADKHLDRQSSSARSSVQAMSEEKCSAKRGTKWLSFWENILLPLNVLTGAIWLSFDFQIVTLLIVLLTIATILGLKKRTRWGWYLNFILLVTITLNYPFYLHGKKIRDYEAYKQLHDVVNRFVDSGESALPAPEFTTMDFLLPFGIAATIVLLPSTIYFANRKYLFSSRETVSANKSIRSSG